MNESEIYDWIIDHPVFRYDLSIDLRPVAVNPETDCIDSNKELNTKVQYWIECDVWEGGTCRHWYELDCGGDTVHEALETLRNNVLEKYGDYEEYKSRYERATPEKRAKFNEGIKKLRQKLTHVVKTDNPKTDGSS